MSCSLLRSASSRASGPASRSASPSPSGCCSPLRLAAVALLSSLLLVPSLRAATKTKDESVPNPNDIALLQQRASQAGPRDQCFLYTQLVNAMTAQAGQQIADGETEQAAATLKQVNQYTHIIHLNLMRGTKRLKDAEILMHNTTYRIGQMLHLVSGDDKTTVQNTFQQVSQVNDEMLDQVFRQQ